MLKELYQFSGFIKSSSLLGVGFTFINILPLCFFQSNIGLAFLASIFLSLSTIFFSRSFVMGFGQLYIIFSMTLLLNLIISEPPFGGILFFIVLVVSIALSDIGGYFGGRFIGGGKVLERISPNKTWAGVIAGWMLVGFFCFSLFFIGVFESHYYLFLFWGVSVSSQLGDFIESYTKRYFGVKDSSNIIPGHGGVLDRFDGLIFSVYFIKIVDFFI